MNFQGRNCVLKLRQNLYGLKDGGRTWWQHCSDGLADMGYKPSSIDQCVYLKEDSIIVYYVDDCIIFTKNDKIIQ